jgi:hypothetical protein
MAENGTLNHNCGCNELDRVFSVTKEYYEELWDDHIREFLRFLRKLFFVALGLIFISLTIIWAVDRSVYDSFISVLFAALIGSVLFTVGFALFYAQSFTLRNEEPESEEGAQLIAANAARLYRLRKLCSSGEPFCIYLREFGGEKTANYLEGSANMDGVACAFPEQECESQIIQALAGSIDHFKFHDNSSIIPNQDASLLFPDIIWKEAFELLIERAVLVIAVVDCEPRPNLLWELSTLAEVAPGKTVVLCSSHKRHIIPESLNVFDWERPWGSDAAHNSRDALSSASCYAQHILRCSGCFHDS